MWTSFWKFLPLPPLWTIFLNNAYVVIWTFGQPPFMSTWFMDDPIGILHFRDHWTGIIAPFPPFPLLHLGLELLLLATDKIHDLLNITHMHQRFFQLEKAATFLIKRSILQFINQNSIFFKQF